MWNTKLSNRTSDVPCRFCLGLWLLTCLINIILTLCLKYRCILRIIVQMQMDKDRNAILERISTHCFWICPWHILLPWIFCWIASMKPWWACTALLCTIDFLPQNGHVHLFFIIFCMTQVFIYQVWQNGDRIWARIWKYLYSNLFYFLLQVCIGFSLTKSILKAPKSM